METIKKKPVRNEGYTNWKKEQFIGNQQKSTWSGVPSSDLEYKEARNTQVEQQEEKNEESESSPWDNFEHTNICFMRVPKGEESKKLETYLKN